MTTYEKIIQLLTENGIHYTEFRHDPVRTSAEATKTRPGTSESQNAKALIVKFEKSENGSRKKDYMMIVLSGNQRFDSKKVRQLFGFNKISFASEEDVVRITNGVVPGGVPPFGNLFGLKVAVDQLLLENDEIAFNAGDRSISIVMKGQDWVALVNPEIHQLV